MIGKYSELEAHVILNNHYNETLTYDLNGNIISLVRNTENTAGVTPIDILAYGYNYPQTGNRLNSIRDSSQNYSGYPDSSGNTIAYDNNGNMTDHIDKGILQINYNNSINQLS